MEFNGITVRGAKEHNLKNIDVQIPRNKITVITGLSGSGKSSLAFDVIYAEGQRRYIESLSAYAKNFLEQLQKPNVDSITGLSPSVAIDQKSINTNPRSTVGTLTEVYDFLRLLYSRVGKAHCPKHKIPVESQTPEQILKDIFKFPKGTRFSILAPMAHGKKGEFLAEFQKWLKRGFTRARVDGEWVELEKAKKLARHKLHDIELLIDRLIVDEKYKVRTSESINLALTLSQGTVLITSGNKKSKMYSIHSACPQCGYSYPKMDPKMFSFNNPRGACLECHGLGKVTYEYEDESEGDDKGEGEDLYLEDCPVCEGSRLNLKARNVLLNQKNISEYASLPINSLIKSLKSIPLKGRDALIAEKIITQILHRLKYMERVGTSYLSLDRRTSTLSGGEAQRVRLASQMGSPLIGVLYVLDEPSIGLHPRDHEKLLSVIREMCDRGNTIILVEHDKDTILSADHIIDIGAGAGRLGGNVIFKGTLEGIKKSQDSLTGQYLSKHKSIPLPAHRRKGKGLFIDLKGAKENNLKNVNLKIPLGILCGVTGVSGSGKSTLIVDTLYKVLAKHFYGDNHIPAEYKSIKGLENLDKVIEINQKPIGRTPRSIPATYVGLFSLIRNLYSQLPEAKLRGYKTGHFSFNVKGGRCEPCQGAGMKRIEMHFLPDVFVLCDDCRGKRYHSETLSIKFREKSIADVLKMTVNEAEEFFRNHRLIHKKLTTLKEVGLGYIHLSQSSTTLSGGEAQRVKLSRELSKRNTGKAIYILDEPTTGLHFEDIRKLIELLNRLVESGNTVIVIEHNMDIIKSCDHIIDLGPEGGNDGGKILASGSPEEIAQSPSSLTGKYLKDYLKAPKGKSKGHTSKITKDAIV